MRINIKGTSESAAVLRGYFIKAGYVISSQSPDYTVHLSDRGEKNRVTVDGIDCELERKVLYELESQGVPEFHLKRAGGVRSDREISITHHVDDSKKIEIALFHAVLRELGHKKVPEVVKDRVKSGIGVLIAFILLTSPAHSAVPKNYVPFNPLLLQPTNFPIVRFWDGSSVVNAGDSANNALRVNVVAGGASGGTSSTFGAAFPATGTAAGFIGSTGNMTGGTLDASGFLKINCAAGCVAGASFADNTVFTFNTTPVGIFGAVVDDVATNTVAENSAAAPRMNTNRILYHMNTNSTGTEVGTNANPLRIDPTGSTAQPVTGPLTDTQLRATPVVVTGDRTLNTAVPGATGQYVLPALVRSAPAAWTAGNLTALAISSNGGLWSELRNSAGTEVGTLANPVFVNLAQSTVKNTYTCNYRLTTRPYALSKAFTANTAVQFATIYHTAGSARTVRILRVNLWIKSNTVAAILLYEFRRLSATTAPATGNPAVTPTLHTVGGTAVDSTCLALPTTAGSEAGANQGWGGQEISLGIIGAGSVINPPPALTKIVLYEAGNTSYEALPNMRAATAEGYAVIIDSSAATTLTATIEIVFTEE